MEKRTLIQNLPNLHDIEKVQNKHIRTMHEPPRESGMVPSIQSYYHEPRENYSVSYNTQRPQRHPAVSYKTQRPPVRHGLPVVQAPPPM